MKKITAEELDKKFDNGEDISEYMDLSTIRKPNKQLKRVNIDFPEWVVASLDREATRLGISRQSLVKMWIAEKIESKAA